VAQQSSMAKYKLQAFKIFNTFPAENV